MALRLLLVSSFLLLNRTIFAVENESSRLFNSRVSCKYVRLKTEVYQVEKFVRVTPKDFTIHKCPRAVWPPYAARVLGGFLAFAQTSLGKRADVLLRASGSTKEDNRRCSTPCDTGRCWCSRRIRALSRRATATLSRAVHRQARDDFRNICRRGSTPGAMAERDNDCRAVFHGKIGYHPDRINHPRRFGEPLR